MTFTLPPGLGCFPLRRVDDYASRVPDEWRERGGVMLPMYQREAMWLQLGAPFWKPHALKVGLGKICAITGEPWSEELHLRPSKGLFRGSDAQRRSGSGTRWKGRSQAKSDTADFSSSSCRRSRVASSRPPNPRCVPVAGCRASPRLRRASLPRARWGSRPADG